MTDRPLKPRELRLIDGVASGLNQTEAAIQAGYPPRSARFEASRAMSRPEMREELARLMETKGLGTGPLLEKSKQLLDSEKFGLTADGRVVSLGPDAMTQQKTLDMLFRAGGLYPDPRLDIELGTQNVLIIDSARSPLAALDPFSPPSSTTERRGIAIPGQPSSPGPGSNTPGEKHGSSKDQDNVDHYYAPPVVSTDT